MNLVYSVTASFAIVAALMTPVYGAPQSRAASAQAIFEQIDGQASAVSDRAFRLNAAARWDRARGVQGPGLDAIRKDINSIAKEVQSLEAQRSSLSEWQARLLDQIEPMVRATADDAQEAIIAFNAGGTGLRAPAYADKAGNVVHDAQAMADLVRSSLKLARAR